MLRTDPSPRPVPPRLSRGTNATPRANDPFVTDHEARIERWLVDHLDDGTRPGSEGDWHELIADSPLRRNDPTGRSRPGKRDAGSEAWSRFRIARRGGVTVLRLKEGGLVRETDLHDLAEELADLLSTGPRRVVLNFAAVERLSCHAAGVLAEAHRRYAASGDAMLKLCALRPPVAEVFSVAGVGQAMPVHVDEASAITTPWPEELAYRRLPVTILQALRRTAREPHGRASSTSCSPSPSLQLIVAAGRGEGTAISLRRRRYLIGRDGACQLRPRSRLVSRRHACLERRNGQVLLHDLDSTNGTLLNGRLLRGESAVIEAGDRIQIGPLRFVVATAPSAATADDQISDWLRDDASVEPALAAEVTMADADFNETLPGVWYEVVEDVLAVTPLASHLDDESSVGPFRDGLLALLERGLPRRVVINLGRVAHLSSLAIGVLVSHGLRLERSGGGLRLCTPQPRVHAILEEIRLPMVLDVLPTQDEAVLGAWTREEA
jgi:anti-anti-sigma factor